MTDKKPTTQYVKTYRAILIACEALAAKATDSNNTDAAANVSHLACAAATMRGSLGDDGALALDLAVEEMTND